MIKMTEFYEKMGQIVQRLKSQQQPGEQPLDTVLRVMNTEGIEAPVPPAISESAPVPGPPKYKFRTLPEMEKGMSAKYGAQWQTIIISTPGLLASIIGVTPDDPKTQAEMHRVYEMLGDDALGSTVYNGKILPFSKLMIEPVV
jgi:hypothetical protein